MTWYELIFQAILALGGYEADSIDHELILKACSRIDGLPAARGLVLKAREHDSGWEIVRGNNYDEIYFNHERIGSIHTLVRACKRAVENGSFLPLTDSGAGRGRKATARTFTLD